MQINLEETETRGRAFVEKEGKTIAEMVYSKAGKDQIIIEHTDVDDQLRGQGAGKQLLMKIVEMAREKNLKVIPLCPFANNVFKKDESISDVLKGSK